MVGTAPNRQPVAELEEGFLRSQSSKEGGLRIMWLAHHARKLDDKVVEGFYCQQVWCEIYPVQVFKILDNIKTRIMRFVRDIERENPNAGEPESGGPPIPLPVVSQIINQNFYGDVRNLATGSSNFNQS